MLYRPKSDVTCNIQMGLGKSKGVQLEIPMRFINSTSKTQLIHLNEMYYPLPCTSFVLGASTLVVCRPNGNTKLKAGKPVVSPILGTDKQF
jgi:hypothetical protein